MIKKIRFYADYIGEVHLFEEYFPIFRVFLSLLTIKETISRWDYNELLYSSNSFISTNDSSTSNSFLELSFQLFRNNINVYFSVFLVLAIFLFFGIGKNVTVILLYLLLEAKQRMCYFTLNGGDTLIKFLFLYLIFANSYKYFALKRMESKRYTAILLSNLAGIAICFHLCLAYWVTAFHKVHSDVWFNGVAVYYIFSIERFQGTPFNRIIANNGYLVTFLTYSTVIIEMFLPILIWFKNTKVPSMLAGVLLHIGIYVFMMIYDFQLIFLSTYGFFLSNEECTKIKNYLKDFMFATNQKIKTYG
jgi:hypothetical protein